MSQILPPQSCPSCEGEVNWVNDLIYCFNKMCPAQWSKKLEHFGKLLKIKGFGPATISKLELGDYPELYELTVEDISSRLGSEKMAVKLATEPPLNSNLTLAISVLLVIIFLPNADILLHLSFSNHSILLSPQPFRNHFVFTAIFP